MEEMEKSVQNDEGLIFTFRGKRVLRKFESSGDEASDNDADIDPTATSDNEVRRQSGVSKRLTRSSIKPRLLFPNADQIRAREAAKRAEEEEAPTDIETPKEIPEDLMDIEQGVEVINPVHVAARNSDSPTQARVSRSKAKIAPESSLPAQAEPAEDIAPEPVPVQAKKPSPFGAWRRTKAGSSSRGGAKREGEPMERNGDAAKRKRSAAIHVVDY